MLNWRGLRLTWIQFTDEDAAAWPTVPESKILVSYVTTDQEFHLQINELSRSDPTSTMLRSGRFGYGISQPAIGWHRFQLFGSETDLAIEAGRLKPFLDRQQFRNPARRAAWKRAHPEFLLKMNKK